MVVPLPGACFFRFFSHGRNPLTSSPRLTAETRTWTTKLEANGQQIGAQPKPTLWGRFWHRNRTVSNRFVVKWCLYQDGVHGLLIHGGIPGQQCGAGTSVQRTCFSIWNIYEIVERTLTHYYVTISGDTISILYHYIVYIILYLHTHYNYNCNQSVP